MISKVDIRTMKLSPAEILSKALVILGCMLEEVPSVTTYPCQEGNSNARFNKYEDAL